MNIPEVTTTAIFSKSHLTQALTGLKSESGTDGEERLYDAHTIQAAKAGIYDDGHFFVNLHWEAKELDKKKQL